MYTIHLADKAIHILPLNDPKKGSPEFQVAPLESFPFREHFLAFASDAGKHNMVLKSSDPQWLFCYVTSFFVSRKAAGGLVINKHGQMLFIFRHGKWDLPKGHPDPGETPEETALRETEEECGVDQLSILSPLPCTYHAFPLKNDQWAMKKTVWFLMTTASTKTPVPQVKEDITRAEWVDRKNIPEIFNNVFSSVRDLVDYALREKML